MNDPTTLGEQIKKFDETMDKIIESLKQLEQNINKLIDAIPNDIDSQE